MGILKKKQITAINAIRYEHRLSQDIIRLLAGLKANCLWNSKQVYS